MLIATRSKMTAIRRRQQAALDAAVAQASARDIIHGAESAVRKHVRAAHMTQAHGEHLGKTPEECLWLRKSLFNLLNHLGTAVCHLIRQGCDELIQDYPFFVRHQVEMLEELTRTHPELLKSSAREHLSWPILAARHHPKPKKFAELADRIELGRETVTDLSPKARYGLEVEINRFLLDLFRGTVETKEDFYFASWPVERPKLTLKTVGWYLDDYIMPMLDEVRAMEGSWRGIPAVQAIVEKLPYEPEHRSAVRGRIKRALRAMAARPGTEPALRPPRKRLARRRPAV